MAFKIRSVGIKQAVYILLAMVAELLAIAIVNPPQTGDTITAVSFLSVIVMVGMLGSIVDSWKSVLVADAIALVEFFIVMIIVKYFGIRGIWNMKSLGIGLILAVINAYMAAYLKMYFYKQIVQGKQN
ncbi:hypothetical protein GM182_00345 [bacterium 3DAC]|nr:hypothetical protein GM182_00345 [bacterium 3DAC]